MPRGNFSTLVYTLIKGNFSTLRYTVAWVNFCILTQCPKGTAVQWCTESPDWTSVHWCIQCLGGTSVHWCLQCHGGTSVHWCLQCPGGTSVHWCLQCPGRTSVHWHDVQFSCAIDQPLLAHHWWVHQCLLTPRLIAPSIPWGVSAPGSKMREQLLKDHNFFNNSPIFIFESSTFNIFAFQKALHAIHFNLKNCFGFGESYLTP